MSDADDARALEEAPTDEDGGEDGEQSLLGDDDDELDEHEHEGKKYKIPRVLKPALMMHADYTQKTQEVAEQRRAVEAERERLTNQVKSQQEHVVALGRLAAADETLKNLDARIEQYEKLNWSQIEQTDVLRAQTLLREYNLLKGTKEKWINHKHEVVRFIQAEDAKRQSDGAERDAPSASTKVGKFSHERSRDGPTIMPRNC